MAGRTFSRSCSERSDHQMDVPTWLITYYSAFWRQRISSTVTATYAHFINRSQQGNSCFQEDCPSIDKGRAIAEDRSEWRSRTYSKPMPPSETFDKTSFFDPEAVNKVPLHELQLWMDKDLLSRWRALRGFRKTLEDDHD